MLFVFAQRCGTLQIVLERERREQATNTLLNSARQRLSTMISTQVRQSFALIDAIDVQLCHAHLGAALSGQLGDEAPLLARRSQACTALGQLASLLNETCAPLGSNVTALAERAARRAQTPAPSAVREDDTQRLRPVIAALAALQETQEALQTARTAACGGSKQQWQQQQQQQQEQEQEEEQEQQQPSWPAHAIVPPLLSPPRITSRGASSDANNWPLPGSLLWSPRAPPD